MWVATTDPADYPILLVFSSSPAVSLSSVLPCYWVVLGLLAVGLALVPGEGVPSPASVGWGGLCLVVVVLVQGMSYSFLHQGRIVSDLGMTERTCFGQ